MVISLVPSLQIRSPVKVKVQEGKNGERNRTWRRLGLDTRLRGDRMSGLDDISMSIPRPAQASDNGSSTASEASAGDSVPSL